MYKMDTTGTFRKESREFEGGRYGVDERGRKDLGFGWGKTRDGGEQLFRRPGGRSEIEESVGVYSKGGKKEE